MKKFKKSVVKNQQDIETFGPREFDENYFTPLEVKVGDNFDKAFKIFKSMVQQDGVLTIYKQKQAFEKPSVKKRRKANESLRRTLEAQMKQERIMSGEYDKDKQKKVEQKERKQREREQINKKVLE